MLNARHIFIVAPLSSDLLNSGQFVFSFSVSMGNNLVYAQGEQGNYASPKIETTPPTRSCDGIPSGYQTHDAPL